MSAATSAGHPSRRPMPLAPSRPAPAAAAQRAFPAFEDPLDEEIVVHLGDIPRITETLDVDGLKPTLLSRLFDMVAPVRSRR